MGKEQRKILPPSWQKLPDGRWATPAVNRGNPHRFGPGRGGLGRQPPDSPKEMDVAVDCARAWAAYGENGMHRAFSAVDNATVTLHQDVI